MKVRDFLLSQREATCEATKDEPSNENKKKLRRKTRHECAVERSLASAHD